MNERTPIRVLQMIDSLDAGGAERMAVNLANALAKKVDFSGLVTTRREGLLKQSISSSVPFLFLERKSTIDLRAIISLVNFIKKNKVNIIHAHSSSFFLGVFIKIYFPKLKLIWHDHYGESEALNKRPLKAIKLASFFFNYIMSVNSKLKNWAQFKLHAKKVIYIRNFVIKPEVIEDEIACLQGSSNSFRIVQVANLRPQKDHMSAFKAIQILREQNLDVTLHCVGAYYKETPYFKNLYNFLKQNNLQNSIFLYGARNDIQNIIIQSSLGMLSSRSEGLPLSLLEFIQSQKPVVVTDVGQCAEVVGEYGKVVSPNDSKALAKAIQYYIEHPDRAQQDALNLHKKVEKEFNPTFIVNQVIDVYKEILL